MGNRRYLLIICAFLLIVFSLNIGVSCSENSTLAPYNTVVSVIETEREGFAERLRRCRSDSARQSVIAEAGRYISDTIHHRLMPHWIGTPWDFHGTSEVPGEGEIACGYFITTLLRDAGFRIQRYRLAQQGAEIIVKKLVSGENIRRYSWASLNDFVSEIGDWGAGVYVVGLDFHVGFVINDGRGIYFAHSSYIHPAQVVCEPARESAALRRTEYRIAGRLTSDTLLIKRWIEGRRANDRVD